MSHHSDDLPSELHELGERLRDERPAMDAFAYDRGQQRVRRAAGGPRRRSRRHSLAVALCLSLGAILSSGGATLAVSGLSSTGSTAVQAQYPTTPTSTATTGTTTTPTSSYTATTGSTTTTPMVAGTTTTETIGTAPAAGGGGTTPAVAGVSATSPTQAAGQVGATQGGGSLPFTGFAAVPVMLAGLALLVGGLALRRRRARDL
jgi:hypothetical protein